MAIISSATIGAVVGGAAGVIGLVVITAMAVIALVLSHHEKDSKQDNRGI